MTPLITQLRIKNMVAGMIKVVCGTITGVVSLINIVTMLYALMHSNSLQDVLQTGLDASGASEELDNIEESVPLKNTLLVSNDSIEVQILKTEKQQMVSVEHATRSTDQPKKSTRVEKNITDNLGIVKYLSQE